MKLSCKDVTHCEYMLKSIDFKVVPVSIKRVGPQSANLFFPAQM